MRNYDCLASGLLGARHKLLSCKSQFSLARALMVFLQVVCLLNYIYIYRHQVVELILNTNHNLLDCTQYSFYTVSISAHIIAYMHA